MSLVTLNVQPGLNTQLTQTANSTGWFASNLVRWRMGQLEKMAGWLRLIEATASGVIRVMHAWLDLQNDKDLLLGTDGGPQIVVNDTLYTLTLNPGALQVQQFSSTTASTTVLVTMIGDVPAVSIGQSVTVNIRVSIGARQLLPGDTFSIIAVGADTFTIAMPLAALTTQTLVDGVPTVGRAAFDIPGTLLTLTWIAHGLTLPGQTFTIDADTGFDDGPTTVLIPAGTVVTAITILSVDTFTFSGAAFGTFAPSAAFTVNVGEVLGLIETTIESALELGPTLLQFVPQNWFSDNLGENGLIMFEGGPLYVYSPPISAGQFVTNASGSRAPQNSNIMFVGMPQAQVIVGGTNVAIGTDLVDPLLLRWSDAGSFSDWIAAVANQAGSYRLSRGSKIMGGIQAPQTTLIVTDTDLWSMSYMGPPLIYGFTIVGTGCGLVAAHAIGTLGTFTYWQTENGIWVYNGGTAQPLPCPVWDTFFRDLDTDVIFKCFVAINSSANEVMFFYPSIQTRPDPPVNLLNYSQEFDNEVWVKVASSVGGPFTAPDGTNTAQQILDSTATSVHNANQSLIKTGLATTYSLSIYCSVLSTRRLGLTVSAQNGTVNTVVAVYNPATGAVVSSAATGTGWTLISASSTTDALATGLAGNGWLRYTLVFTTDTTHTLQVTVSDVTAGGVFNFAGTGLLGVVVWGVQLSLGASLQAYEAQEVVPSNECSRYVKYNAVEGLWDICVPRDEGVGLPRTSWIDNNVFGTALGADHNLRIQQHEKGYDDDDEPMRDVYATTGYGRLSDGNVIMKIGMCIPDFKWFGEFGSVNISVGTMMYPGLAPQSYGPFPVTSTQPFFIVHGRGRGAAVTYEWGETRGFSARIGAVQFDISPAGAAP